MNTVPTFENFAILHCLRMQALYLQLLELKIPESRALIEQYQLGSLAKEGSELPLETRLAQIENFKIIMERQLQTRQFHSALLMEHVLFFCRAYEIIEHIDKASLEDRALRAIIEPIAQNILQSPWAAVGIAEQWAIELDLACGIFLDLPSLKSLTDDVNELYGETYELLKKIQPKERAFFKRFRKQPDSALPITSMSQEKKKNNLFPKNRPSSF